MTHRIVLVLAVLAGGCLIDRAHPGDPADAAAPDAAVPDGGAADLDPTLADLALLRPPRASPIAAENQLPGDPGWHRQGPSTGLYGFADRQSYRPGDTVAVHAAADSASDGTWELWRLGYYGGAGGRRISAGQMSIPQATPAVMDAMTGMVSAPWPTTFTVALAPDLVTGVYLVKLISPSAQSYVIFVVRDPRRGAPVVWPVPFNTYQAYNAWGGTGLYNNTRSDWPEWHAYAVSFDRPYLQGDGSGQLLFADRDFITFVEGQGYDLDYVADSDVDADGDELAGRALVVLQGHAEYWSAAQRAAVEDAVARRTNLVVFGANDLFWQVRYQPSAAGVPRRVLVGYKEFAASDPAQATAPATVTTEWRLLGKPENALFGEMFGEWIWSSVPLVVSDPSLWLWRGAGVEAGAMITGLYGFEIDRRFANGYEPAGVIEVGRGLGENHSAGLAAGQATLYTAPSGATVFASGTVSWSQALARAGMWDARVQQATHNLFARLGGGGVVGAAPQPLVLPPGAAPPVPLDGVAVTTVTAALSAPTAVALAPGGDVIVLDGDRLLRVAPGGAVTPVAGGANGDADGTPGAFSGPRGLAVGGDGTIYVADTSNHKIKKVVGGVVTTIAGGNEGYADGATGELDTPMALVLRPSGTLLIADVWNMRVRALSPAGALSTWAGNGTEASIDGPGASASLYFPFAMAALADGSVAVAESNDGVVRRIANDAAHTVTTLAGELGRTGWNDGTGDVAALSELAGLGGRANGDLVLLDAASYRLRLWRSSDGSVATLAGGASAALVDGDGAHAGFSFPRAVVAADAHTLYVADTGNHALRRISLP